MDTSPKFLDMCVSFKMSTQVRESVRDHVRKATFKGGRDIKGGGNNETVVVKCGRKKEGRGIR